MKTLSIQEAFRRKFERQVAIDKLEYHASGHCVHIGKLSPGCAKCFVPSGFTHNFHIGSKCNCHCVYCYGGRKGEILDGPSLQEKAWLLKHALTTKIKRDTPIISFTGGGDPLMNLDVITKYMKFLHCLEKDIGTKPWYYLYTNGLLANTETLQQLKDLGFDEIRFHIGASNFSPDVYKNISEAIQYLNTVTIETPAWPLHREKLFEMLPIIEDIGVKHLNLGEIEITQQNQKRIKKAIPDAEVYQCFAPHLYDGGLVYDIIEEVLEKNYSFSVLDCSCFVKSIQRTPGKHLIHEDIEGLCKR